MRNVRPAAVAGAFYPASPTQLDREVEALLDRAPAVRPPIDATTVRAIVVPHAGYLYSGPTAAVAYAALRSARMRPASVAILGPSHHARFTGFATAGADAFATPLGELQIDEVLEHRLQRTFPLQPFPPAHAAEHCLEVQLPLIQRALGTPLILPVLVSAPDRSRTAELMLALADAGVLVIVSSDLSHFHPDADARRIDRATVSSILDLDTVSAEQACGCVAVNGLTEAARRAGWQLRLLDTSNSSDATPHTRDRVVGYASFVATFGDRPTLA